MSVVIVNPYVLSGGFLPTSLSNLYVWVRADTEIYQDDALTTPATGTDLVGGWKDQSGNDRHIVQATESNKPILNGSGVVNFVSSDSLLHSTAYTTAPATWFALVNPSDLTGFHGIVGSGTTNGRYGMGLNGDEVAIYAGTGSSLVGETSTNPITTGNWYRLIALFDPATDDWDIYINGSLIGSGTSTLTSSMGAFGVGRVGTTFFAGLIKEAGMYLDIKSPEDIAKLDGYLASIP